MSKITESARGKSCAARFVGPYSHDPETVVHCHYRISGVSSGTGMKPHDMFGARLCYDCHRIADQRDLTALERHLYTREYTQGEFAKAVLLTQAQLINEGLL